MPKKIPEPDPNDPYNVYGNNFLGIRSGENPAGPPRLPQPSPPRNSGKRFWWWLSGAGFAVITLVIVVVVVVTQTGSGSPGAANAPSSQSAALSANTPTAASPAQPTGAATQQDPNSSLPLYQGAQQSQAAIAAATAHLPVQIEGVSDLNNDPENSRALATGVRLSAQQLAQVSSNYLNGGAQNYLPASLDPVPTQFAYTDVTLKGNEVNPVTITGLRVVKQCRPPLSGTLFFSPSQGIDNTIRVGFDLDSSISYAQVVSGGSIGGGDFFAQHVVTLAPGEVQTFELYLKTDQHDCRFTFQMSVATPTGTISEKIDDNGKPYELTAILDTSAYQDLYLGGAADADGTTGWVQSDPKTYH